MDFLSGVTGLRFDPAVPLWIAGLLAALILAAFVYGLWRGMRGCWLRLFAGLALLAALLDPRLISENREPLTDVALLLIDESDSQQIDGREALAQAAANAMIETAARLDNRAPLELRVERVKTEAGAESDAGTRLFTAMETALADVGRDRIAGAVVVTDGRAHDAPDLTGLSEDEIAERFPGPLHVLSTGREGAYDRRIVLESAPSFGIVGEDVAIRLRVEDLGDVPAGAPVPRITLSIDGQMVRQDLVREGESAEIRAPLDKGGASVFELEVASLDGELTTRNNRALFTVQGARDRLRVLLISGQPHAGQRGWRNLLKADPSVDLVHFTILRPPRKLGGTPVSELSLIPFPTRELFMEKIDDFDLVIFDRYIRHGVLAPAYLSNVAAYVERGGAVFIATGPDFGGASSLWRSPLGRIMPASPTGALVEALYKPLLTDKGTRHPVTADLPDADTSEPGWGSWMRLSEVQPLGESHVLMSGAGDSQPLLLLDRVGEGRVAMLASDTAWLWARGYEGGGPLAEMLRRVAHWLMKEPQLEEDALTAAVSGAEVTVTRRTLDAQPPEQAQIVAPSGERLAAPFGPAGPGRFVARFDAKEQGLYSITDGLLDTSAAVGPASPKEFENPIATFDIVGPVAAATGGAQLSLRDGLPQLRRVSGERRAYGSGWIGLRERGAYVVRDQRAIPLAPGWLMLLLSTALLFLAWRREGR